MVDNEKNDAPNAGVAPAEMKKKHASKVWSEASCKKVAGRFGSEEEWKKGSPSSYKAAVAHNWHSACLDHQKWRQQGDELASLPKSA